MRNGTHSKLTLVDESAAEGPEPDDAAAAYYPYRPDSEAGLRSDESLRASRIVLIFAAISVACAAATVATGSYAAWLSRHQATEQALTDVNDILRSCQSRMSQLESDMHRLPKRQA